MNKKLTSGIILTLLMTSTLTLTFSLKPASAEPTTITEDFSEPVLNPSWQTVPGLGRYSLTDRPGYLRYYLDGPLSYSGGWRTGYKPGAWNPSLTLLRRFEGSDWVLRTKVTYNYRWYGTGAQGNLLWIAFGEGNKTFLQIHRLIDQWYGTDILAVHLLEEDVVIAANQELRAPDDVVRDGWLNHTYWYEIMRQGQEITFRYSYDGTNYITVFLASFTTSVEVTQRVIIDANVWTTAGSHGDWDYIYVETPTIPATVDIHPDTLSFKSKGKWITAYIELPEGYNVNDLDVATVKINGTIPADLSAPTQTGDHDNDGITDLMVKFDRAYIISWLRAIDHTTDTGSHMVNLRMTGRVKDVTFEGFDTIMLLTKG